MFDIGGTFVRAGLYAMGKGLIGETVRVEAQNFITEDISLEVLQGNVVETCTKITKQLEAANKDIHVGAVGIGFPGPIGPGGVVLKAPSLWGELSTPYPLKEKISKKLSGYDIVIINDLTAAGYRYIDLAGGTFCIFTISSGVGCKVFWEGKVLLNNNGFGGEIGHHFYGADFTQIPCDCGERGHIANISSGRGILKISNVLRERKPELFKKSVLNNGTEFSTYELVEAIKGKDAFALYLLREAIKPIAASISSLYGFIGVDRYVIVGGFAAAIGEKYIEILKEEVKNMRMFGASEQDVDRMVIGGHRDDNSGLIGMGRYIFEIYNKTKLA